MTLALLFWMGGNDTTPASQRLPSDAGSGGRKKKPPQIRLRNGRLYQPATYEEFRRLLAKIEYRTGYKPLMALPTAKPEPQADFARWSANVAAQQQLLLEKQRLMLDEEEAALALLLLSME